MNSKYKDTQGFVLGGFVECKWCQKPLVVTRQRYSALSRAGSKGNAFCDDWCNTRWYNREKSAELRQQRVESQV